MTEKQNNWLKGAGLVALLVAFGWATDGWKEHKYQMQACSELQFAVQSHPVYGHYSDLILESCDTASFAVVPARKYPNVNETLVTIFATSRSGMPSRRVAFSGRVDEYPFGWFVDELQLVGTSR
jgi:hypothetical protein